MTRPKYVVGCEGSFRTFTDGPFVWDDAPNKRVMARWAGGGGFFVVQRGTVAEHTFSREKKLVYAREIPEPQAVELEKIDEELTNLRKQIAVLEGERQLVCMMAATRGKRVRVTKG